MEVSAFDVMRKVVAIQLHYYVGTSLLIAHAFTILPFLGGWSRKGPLPTDVTRRSLVRGVHSRNDHAGVTQMTTKVGMVPIIASVAVSHIS